MRNRVLAFQSEISVNVWVRKMNKVCLSVLSVHGLSYMSTSPRGILLIALFIRLD